MNGIVLFLNDVGGSEVALILLFILIFFGSKSIPGIARSAGKTMRQIRDAQEEVQRGIQETGNKIKKEFDDQNKTDGLLSDFKKPFEEIGNTVNEELNLDQQFPPPNQFSRPFGETPLKPIDSSKQTSEEV
jgi:sec-independent protein translocase protein TatA